MKKTDYIEQIVRFGNDGQDHCDCEACDERRAEAKKIVNAIIKDARKK